MSKFVDIAAAIDSRYLLPLVTTIFSAWRRLDAGYRIRLHVLHGDLTAADESFLHLKLDRVLDLSTYAVADPLRLSRRNRHFSSANLLRLQIAETLTEMTGRVLYLDADVLVLEDLSSLIQQGDHRFPISAVIDTNHPHGSARLHPSPSVSESGAAPPGYFNAGVMVINLDLWRREELGIRATDIARGVGQSLPYLDQDILNVLCAGRWRRLPARWNRLIERRGGRLLGTDGGDSCPDSGVLHYCGSTKPWQDHFPGGWLRQLYEDECRFADEWTPDGRGRVNR